MSKGISILNEHTVEGFSVIIRPQFEWISNNSIKMSTGYRFAVNADPAYGS